MLGFELIRAANARIAETLNEGNERLRRLFGLDAPERNIRLPDATEVAALGTPAANGEAPPKGRGKRGEP